MEVLTRLVLLLFLSLSREPWFLVKYPAAILALCGDFGSLSFWHALFFRSVNVGDLSSHSLLVKCPRPQCFFRLSVSTHTHTHTLCALTVLPVANVAALTPTTQERQVVPPLFTVQLCRPLLPLSSACFARSPVRYLRFFFFLRFGSCRHMTSTASIISNLQGHQAVLLRELEEIHADLGALHALALRYARDGVSVEAAMDQLHLLRSEKEQLLARVGSQIESIQASIASSTQLVHQLSLPTPAPTLASAGLLASPARPTSAGLNGSALGSVSAVGRPSAQSSAYLNGQSRTGVRQQHSSHPTVTASAAPSTPGLVTFNCVNGLVVTTNSSILANSPQRSRLY